MTPTHIPPFEVVETDRGRTYRLPPHDIGGARWVAVLPLGFVVLLSVCLAKFYLKRAALGLPDDWFWAIFVVLVPGWAWMVYTGLDITAAFWCGHAEIEVSHDGRVTAYDRAGWFGICLSWFRHGAAGRLILEECSTREQQDRTVWGGLLRGLWQLTAEGKNGSRGWLAIGYPREVLAALAEHLARHLAVAPPDTTDPAPPDNAPPAPAAPAAPVPVLAEVGFPNRDIPEPPLNTRVTIERHPDGLTLTVPRLGLKGKNAEPFCLGAFLAAIFGTLTVATVVSWIRGNLEFPPGLVIGPGLLAVGVGIMLYWVNAGLKKVVLAVVGDTLLIFETGPLGSRRREFAHADLLDIACRSNDHVPDLQIVTLEKRAVALLAGRTEPELKWIATLLRHALGIPSEAPAHRKPPLTPAKPWRSPRTPGTPPAS